MFLKSIMNQIDHRLLKKINLIPNERNRRLEKVKTKREILIKRTEGKKYQVEETKG